MAKEESAFLAQPELGAVLKIQSAIMGSARDFLASSGFIEMLPVMLSTETDPLCHEVIDAKIPYYDTEYYLMKSMILHKLIAVSYVDKFFIFSPNIRLETADKKDTGRHLIEFTQLDLEMRYADREQIMALGEKLIAHTIRSIIEKCGHELKLLGRKIAAPQTPFERITYADAVKKFGPEFEHELSKEAKGPIWLTDIPIERREFYDREDPKRPGILLDMDLIYPEGYGEAMSGGEREYEYSRIVQRITKSGKRPEDFKKYLELAKKGLPHSSGFGFGIERLTRYICGLESVKMARLFPKVPGAKSAL